ncbi:hypothetical protein ACFQEX_06710 [Roseibium salinum]
MLDRSIIDLEQLGRLRAAYTMDRERRVHDGLFGEAQDSTSALQAPQTQSDDLDDIFF